MSQGLVGGSSSTSGLPQQYRGQVGKNLLGLMSPGSGRSSALGALSLDPNQLSSVGTSLSNITSPGYTQNIAQDPSIQALLKSYTAQNTLNKQQSGAQLGSQFARYGQAGSGANGPEGIAQGSMMAQEDVGESSIASQALFNQLSQRESMQLPALSQLQGFNLLPIQLQQALAPFLQKSSGSTQPGYLSDITSGAGSLASAIGSIMA